MRKSILPIVALKYEANNSVMPNFLLYFRRFDIDYTDITNLSKDKIKRLCRTIYDNHWWDKLVNSPKALSYILFKSDISLEPYLSQIKNPKLRNSISRFRMSNHMLMIEKGRHLRPKIEREKRFCFNCCSEIEDESHFLISCPIYIVLKGLHFSRYDVGILEKG